MTMKEKGCMGCVCYLVFSVAFVATITYLWRVNNPEEAAAHDAEVAKERHERKLKAQDPLAGYEIKLCNALQEEVRDRLAAPSTADFEGCWHQPISYKGNGLYDGGFYVDAQNAFGAKLRSWWAATATVTKDSPDPSDRKFTYRIDSLQEVLH